MQVISPQWLELLKQIVPSMTRAAVLRDATQGAGTSEFAVIQAMAPSLRVEVNPVNMRDAGEIERAVVAFARSPNGGLIVTGAPAATLHRELIITLAARHKLPTVYGFRLFSFDKEVMSPEHAPKPMTTRNRVAIESVPRAFGKSRNSRARPAYTGPAPPLSS